MKTKFNKYLLSFSSLLICATMLAQKPPEPTGPPPGPGLPIDGGLFVLLISGVAYGIYELKRKK